MSRTKPEVEWQEVSLASVLRYYADGFKPKDGETLDVMESFCDHSKGVVIFKLLVRRAEANGEAKS